MRPHRTDGISLSFGLVFLLVALWWAIAQVVTIHLPAAGWLVAGGLIMFGAIGLLGAIRSGRRPEVPAPVQAEAQVETPGDLPPEMHADIVRELLDNPADRTDLHPAYLKHPVSAPPTAEPARAQTATLEPATFEPAKTETAKTETVAAETAKAETVAAETAMAETVGDETVGDEPTAEVTRVDLGQESAPERDPDGTPQRG